MMVGGTAPIFIIERLAFNDRPQLLPRCASRLQTAKFDQHILDLLLAAVVLHNDQSVHAAGVELGLSQLVGFTVD
jgi:hypothetical protein